MALAFIFVLSLFIACNSELPSIQQFAKNDGSLALLVVGDWGRRGTYNQSQVAQQMGKIGEQMDIDFVISVGDNFYDNGLTGVNDEAFSESFTNIYTAQSLQKPWYSILGNHDYRGNALAQFDPVLQKLENRWICKRSFMVDAEIAQFFFVDTTPFVEKYWTKPKGDHYDWRGVAPREEYIQNAINDLNLALKESTATWKIVVGHHPIRSVSEHGDTKELLSSLLPVLKINGVDLYLNGHDHCLEHISSTDSPIQFLTSGAGSKAWRGVYNPTTEKLRFFYDGQGFLSLKITSSIVDFGFFDVYGNILHKGTVTKNLNPFM